jgi:hypothetical protein
MHEAHCGGAYSKAVESWVPRRLAGRHGYVSLLLLF